MRAAIGGGEAVISSNDRRGRREPRRAARPQGRLLVLRALRYNHCVDGRRPTPERNPGSDGDRRSLCSE
jgi:hypothetical protein